ncbi:MAG: hypothetical protein V4560_03040 [Bacteroidota bacterium]
MKKTALTVMMAMFFLALFAQPRPMINKSKSYVIKNMQQDKSFHLTAIPTDPNINEWVEAGELRYVKTYKPKGYYAFETSSVYYFTDGVCTSYMVNVPSNYLRYMMALLKGYSQIDERNFISFDHKTHLQLGEVENTSQMHFMRQESF